MSRRALALLPLLVLAAYALGRFMPSPAARAQEHEHRATPPAAPTTDPHTEHRAPPADEHTEHRAPATTEAPRERQPGVREERRVEVKVLPEQQRRIGLKTAPVESRAVTTSIKSVGLVTADERRAQHVHVKSPGWIEAIHADAVGQPVRRGAALFHLYSPEIASTELEYVSSIKLGPQGAPLAATALTRLALLDVPALEIERLRRTLVPQSAVRMDSPMSGFVLEKNALKGMYVTPDMQLYSIADLSKIWVVITLYENELPLVRFGDIVEVELPYTPGTRIRGAISYIYPDIDAATRTGKARIEVLNQNLVLKPGMYATTFIEKSLGDAVVVPADAVLTTGRRDIVFVAKPDNQFEPREIVLGPRVEDGFAVLEGLAAGERVVVRAAFLIDAESRLQAALESGAAPAGHAGHGG